MKPDRCDVCGIEALDGQIFTKDGIGKPNKLKSYCPNCHQHLQQKILKNLLYIQLGFVGLGVIFLITNVMSSLGYFYLNIAWLWLSVIIALIFHEFAHAFVGRWVGLQVPMIVLGYGGCCARFKLWDFEIELRKIPLGGVTFFLPKSSNWVRTKYFLSITAGPLVNLLLAGVVWWVLKGKSPFVGFVDSLHFFEIFILGNLYIGILNLIPFVATLDAKQLPTDGLAILQLIFLQKLPFVPISKNATQQSLLKWVAAPFLAGIGLVFVGMALIAIKNGIKTNDSLLFILSAFFVPASCLLLFLAYKAWCLKLALKPLVQKASLNPYSSILHNYGMDLRSKIPGNDVQQFEKFNVKLHEFYTANDRPGALCFIEEELKRYPKNLFLEACRGEELFECDRLLEAEKAMELLVENHEFSSSARAVLFLILAKAIILQGKFNEAEVRINRFIEGHPIVNEKIYVLDYLATIPLQNKRFWSYSSEALRLIEKALGYHPKNLTLLSTKGALLVELGNLDEGELHLNEVIEKSTADVDKGYSAFYLSEIAKKRGDLKKSEQFRKKAMLWYPAFVLLKNKDSEVHPQK